MRYGKILILSFICFNCTNPYVKIGPNGEKDYSDHHSFSVVTRIRSNKLSIKVGVSPICTTAPNPKVYEECKRNAKQKGLKVEVRTTNSNEVLTQETDEHGKVLLDLPEGYIQMRPYFTQELKITVKGRVFKYKRYDLTKLVREAKRYEKMRRREENYRRETEYNKQELNRRSLLTKPRKRNVTEARRIGTKRRNHSKDNNFSRSRVSMKGTYKKWEGIEIGWKKQQVVRHAKSVGWKLYKTRQVVRCHLFELIFEDIQNDLVAVTFYKNRTYWIERRSHKSSTTISEKRFLSFISSMNNKYGQPRGKSVPHSLGIYFKYKWQPKSRTIEIVARKLYKNGRVRILGTLLHDNVIKDISKKCYGSRR